MSPGNPGRRQDIEDKEDRIFGMSFVYEMLSVGMEDVATGSQ